MLLIISLATDTLPFYRDYRKSVQNDKLLLKKRALSAITELEDLKPAVQLRLDELSRKHAYQSNGWSDSPQPKLLESSKSLPSVRQQTSVNNYTINKQFERSKVLYDKVPGTTSLMVMTIGFRCTHLLILWEIKPGNCTRVKLLMMSHAYLNFEAVFQCTLENMTYRD